MQIYWKVIKLRVADSLDGLSKVVVSVDWSVTASNTLDGINRSASVVATTDIGKPDGEDFVPFEELIEETVIDWVKATLGDEMVTWYEARSIRDVNAQSWPVIVESLPPWEIEQQPQP